LFNGRNDEGVLEGDNMEESGGNGNARRRRGGGGTEREIYCGRSSSGIDYDEVIGILSKHNDSDDNGNMDIIGSDDDDNYR
ncbi:2014_t:CDS:2, partial [Entrophospora sp. SA101]